MPIYKNKVIGSVRTNGSMFLIIGINTLNLFTLAYVN